MSSMIHMERITRRAVRTCTNIMFLSPPARGKTAMGEKIQSALLAEGLIDITVDFDCGTLAPTDVVMSMPNMVDLCVQQIRDQRLPDVRKDPGIRGIINLHEWMLAGLEVNRGFQKLINHERDGMGFAIPPGVIFRADGNRLTDRAGAQQQSRAIMSRFRVYPLEYDVDYALGVVKDHYHERVAAFLIRNPGLVDNYSDVFENDQRGANDLTRQEGNNGAWASLRGWNDVSKVLRDADATGEQALPDEIISAVGSGVAQTFAVWCSMLDKLATMEEIIAKPDKVPVPEKMDESYALSTMLAMTVNKDTFKPISIYMNRYAPELQASFFRLMNDRLAKAKDGNSTAIRASAEYKAWITAKHISKLLVGASQ